MNSNNTTFNGSHNAECMCDPITYCPHCGKKFNINTEDIKYCPYCGKAIPRTYTGGSYIIHWNLPEGTVTYPYNGVDRTYITC